MNDAKIKNISTTTSAKLGVVLIAAGNSSRLGQAKQLVCYQNEPLLNKAYRLATSISDSIVCVLGFDYQRFTELSNLTAQNILVNKRWQTGMGTSIATGVKYFTERSAVNENVDAILVLLCDQYLLTSLDLKKLHSQWTMNRAQIIASQYFEQKTQQEVLGAPAIFPKKYFKDLLGLTNKGARNLLHQYRQDVIAVELKNAATDLDTKNDLQQLQALDDLNTENNHD